MKVSHGFGGVGDDDKAFGGDCDQLLAGMCPAPSLDEPTVRGDLVSTVDGHV